LEGEPGATKAIQYAMEAEKVHAQLYSRAKDAVTVGRDTEMGPVVVCDICGYTAEGEAPGQVPTLWSPKRALQHVLVPRPTKPRLHARHCRAPWTCFPQAQLFARSASCR